MHASLGAELREMLRHSSLRRSDSRFSERSQPRAHSGQDFKTAAPSAARRSAGRPIRRLHCRRRPSPAVFLLGVVLFGLGLLVLVLRLAVEIKRIAQPRLTRKGSRKTRGAKSFSSRGTVVRSQGEHVATRFHVRYHGFSESSMPQGSSSTVLILNPDAIFARGLLAAGNSQKGP